MALDRIRDRLDRDGPDRQRVSEESVSQPDEVQDPTTFRDEATPTFKERFERNKYRIIGQSFLIIAVLGAGIIYTRRYFPGLYTHPVTTRGVPLAVLLGLAVFAGTRQIRGTLKEMDWLILNYPQSLGLYLGEFDTDDTGTRTFVPYRGFSLMGGKSIPYELGELSDGLAQSAAKKGRSADDPVRMALPGGEMYRHVDTWFGTVGSVITDGMVPDTTNPDVDLIVTASSNDHADVMDDLIDRLRKKRSKVGELEDKLETMREQRDHYQREAKKTREDIRDEERDFITDVMVATRNPSQLSDEDQADGPSKNGGSVGGIGDGGLPPELEDEIDV